MGLLGSWSFGRGGSEDERLVRRASGGDAEAFAELYERYMEPVFRFFYYRLGGSRENAEDLTEQSFLKAWQSIGSYDYRGIPFSAWLFRIAHNLLVDYHRIKRDAEPIGDDFDLEDEALGPEEQVMKKAEVEELSAALGQLSPIEQSVVTLRFLQGLDHRTVARIIDKSEVATRSIQFRALERLAQILGGRSRK